MTPHHSDPSDHEAIGAGWARGNHRRRQGIASVGKGNDQADALNGLRIRRSFTFQGLTGALYQPVKCQNVA